MNSISIRVSGLPVGQPRVRAVRRGNHAGVYDPGTANEWKACVIHAAREAIERNGWPILTGPIILRIEFRLPRPKSHFGSGRNASEVKPSAPKWHVQKPDLDNLEKAVKDALTSAGVWVDDCQVAQCGKSKAWVSGGGGATIEIRRLDV